MSALEKEGGLPRQTAVQGRGEKSTPRLSKISRLAGMRQSFQLDRPDLFQAGIFAGQEE